MKHCSECGAKVTLQQVGGDEKLRFVCVSCGITHYQNPTILVATYVCAGTEILWIKRGIAPAQGRWAMPGGFMENDETPEEASSRELFEETGIAVAADEMILVSVSSILHMAQTHLVFRCHLDAPVETSATEEAPESAWFDDATLPWGDIAFPSIEPQIRQMYRWLTSGRYGIRVGVVGESGTHYKNYPLAD